MKSRKRGNDWHELNLRDNDTGDDGAKAIGVALVQNKTLTTLDLNYSYIEDYGAIAKEQHGLRIGPH